MPATIVILFIALRPRSFFVGFVRRTQSREGKILAFVALCVLPITAVWGGFSEQMERAESTQFCLSCHVMTDFGRSLYVDDPSYLPARHFQNNRVPRDRACYTCHTDYAMFGTVRAKLRGLPSPGPLFRDHSQTGGDQTLSAHNNRECCIVAGARRFQEGSGHHKTPDLLQASSPPKILLSSGHDIVTISVRSRCCVLKESKSDGKPVIETRIKGEPLDWRRTVDSNGHAVPDPSTRVCRFRCGWLPFNWRGSRSLFVEFGPSEKVNKSGVSRHPQSQNTHLRWNAHSRTLTL
jgi:hypothetical protein